MKAALLALALLIPPAFAGEPPAGDGSAASPGTGMLQMPAGSVAGVLGETVHGADGKEMGRIVDVVVDQSGRPRAAVIDFGGFLGVGNRRVAVVWEALHFKPGKDGEAVIDCDLTPDQIRDAPEYRETGGMSAVAKPRGAPRPPPGPPAPPVASPLPGPAAPAKP